MSKLLLAPSLAIFALTISGFSSGANADASSSLYVVKSVNVNASATVTWDKISKFGDLGAWHPAVAKTEITAGAEGKKGAKRTLTLQDGGKINEKLTAYNVKQKTMSYGTPKLLFPEFMNFCSHFIFSLVGFLYRLFCTQNECLERVKSVFTYLEPIFDFLSIILNQLHFS